eukprot:7361288-Pyramimonas_sp.AAC.1
MPLFTASDWSVLNPGQEGGGRRREVRARAGRHLHRGGLRRVEEVAGVEVKERKPEVEVTSEEVKSEVRSEVEVGVTERSEEGGRR